MKETLIWADTRPCFGRDAAFTAEQVSGQAEH